MEQIDLIDVAELLTLLPFNENSSFCDTGHLSNFFYVHFIHIRIFAESPLWDGISGCGDASCCAPHSGP